MIFCQVHRVGITPFFPYILLPSLEPLLQLCPLINHLIVCIHYAQFISHSVCQREQEGPCIVGASCVFLRASVLVSPCWFQVQKSSGGLIIMFSLDLAYCPTFAKYSTSPSISIYTELVCVSDLHRPEDSRILVHYSLNLDNRHMLERNQNSDRF